jgi:uncharacterized protein YndB with AHSA1/START domain
MTKAEFVYVTYIRTTPDRVWNAIVDRDISREYWGHSNVSDWKVGSKWEHRDKGADGKAMITGKVVEFVPPRRMVLTWGNPPGAQDTSQSRVTFELEQVEDMVRLSVTHDELEAGSEMQKGINHGWPLVLSSLKSYLETGKSINLWAWKKEAAAKS